MKNIFLQEKTYIFAYFTPKNGLNTFKTLLNLYYLAALPVGHEKIMIFPMHSNACQDILQFKFCHIYIFLLFDNTHESLTFHNVNDRIIDLSLIRSLPQKKNAAQL